MNIFKKFSLAVLAASAFSFAFAAIETVDESTVKVSTVDELKEALLMEKIETVILTKCLDLEDGTVLDGAPNGGKKKTVSVEKPFLPEDGRVKIEAITDGNGNITGAKMIEPLDNTYTKTNLFNIAQDAKVVISNMVLTGGFCGPREVGDNPSVGGIDNHGFLEMSGVDMLRTGTALLNRPNARALLVCCNIVRNANWYGGGILNFSKRKDGTDEYYDGGVLIMDRCSLTENESLGPSHGGGAAENQGIMCLNNCVVANNASTEIGGGINNCKGGKLFVMNSVFTGNVTTSDAYGIMAGGAIGNAGGASHVHIVGSIFAYNGYDDGESIIPSSVACYNENVIVHVSMSHCVYDAVAGLPRIEMTGTTKEYGGIFGNVANIGIIAAGSTKSDGETSSFDHPLVTTPESMTDEWALAPDMLSQKADHFIFQNAVTTYFDYSGFFEDEMSIGMAYNEGGEIKPLGDAIGIPSDLESSRVTISFDGSSRDPINSIGSGSVTVQTDDGPQDDGAKLFIVQLDEFTGGRVSGVTVYKDSYRSNSVITVHGIPNSAYYLDGWNINGKLVPGTAQKYIYSFTVVTNILIKPVFLPVETQILRVRQRYPWNNLVDIDYSVSEKDAVDYRLVFIAKYTDENGVEQTLQLKSFVKNSGKNENGKFEEQRLGWKSDLRRAGEHRVTWDSAKDGVRLKNKTIKFRLMACEGDER